MQGKKGTIGSLPDSINFGYEPTSSNVGADHQICWNSLPDPAQDRLSDFRAATGDRDSVLRTLRQEVRNLSGWNTGESSSSNVQNRVDNDASMTQSGWSSSMADSAGYHSRLEDQAYGHANVMSRNNANLNSSSNNLARGISFMPSSSSSPTPETREINIGQFARSSGDIMDHSGSSKSGGLEHRLTPASGSSTSGSGAFMLEGDDMRAGCSLDGRRFSCKRKAIEGHFGQSSNGAGLSISPPSQASPVDTTPDQLNPRLRLSMRPMVPDNARAPSVGSGAESSHRSYRVRTNPTGPQHSLTDNSASGRQPRRFVPANPPLDMVPPVQPDNVSSQGQSVVLRLPGLRRNVESVSRSWASVPPSSEERDTPLHAGLNPRPVSGSISERPMSMPLADDLHNPSGWSFGGGSSGASQRAGSSSGVGHVSSLRRPTPAQYSRRLSEYLRRSMLSSPGSESGLLGASTEARHSAPFSSSQDTVLPSGGGSHGQNPPPSRSGLWMDRHGDGAGGIPLSLRTLAAGSEGRRSRLVSEHVRNVLDMMRRGEGLRFEDVLDPSLLFDMADMYDQHRDMRLDVDNMSYEELLALEERIGDVCTGLTEEKISAHLKNKTFSVSTGEAYTEREPCCICQEEYTEGEDLGALDCGHEFHRECIKQWLGQKNLCPVCKTTGLSTIKQSDKRE